MNAILRKQDLNRIREAQDSLSHAYTRLSSVQGTDAISEQLHSLLANLDTIEQQLIWQCQELGSVPICSS